MLVFFFLIFIFFLSGSVIEVIQMKSDVSCTPCHRLSPEVGGFGVREQNDACSSLPAVRHYEAVRMTSKPYAGDVPLSFVPLHYDLPTFVFGRPFSLSARRSFMLYSPVSASVFFPL